MFTAKQYNDLLKKHNLDWPEAVPGQEVWPLILALLDLILTRQEEQKSAIRIYVDGKTNYTQSANGTYLSLDEKIKGPQGGY